MEVNLKRIERVDLNPLVPDGVYEGKWGGYHVEFTTPVGTFRGETDVGVRGIDVPCTVTVSKGGFSVDTEKG